MKDSSRNLLVGVFVTAALGALAVLMVWFGETPSWLRRSEWTLRIVGVQDLRGISEGSPVNLNGVQIGRVASLKFEDPARPDKGVVILAQVGRMYSVPRGAYAKVYGATLGIGTGHIQITVPAGAGAVSLPKEDASVRGEMSSMIGEIVTKDLVDSIKRTIDNIGNFAEASKPVMNNLERFLEQRRIIDVDKGMTANVTTVIERMDNLVAHLNSVLGDENVQADMKGVVRDLKDSSEQIKEVVVLWKRETMRLSDNLNTGIDRTEENLEQSFIKANTVLENLAGASRSLARVLLAIEEGKGTAGLMVRDERLYESAVLALDRLADVLATIDRITTKIEEDGHFTIAQETAVGTFKKDFPVGSASQAADAR